MGTSVRMSSPLLIYNSNFLCSLLQTTSLSVTGAQLKQTTVVNNKTLLDKYSVDISRATDARCARDGRGWGEFSCHARLFRERVESEASRSSHQAFLA